MGTLGGGSVGRNVAVSSEGEAVEGAGVPGRGVIGVSGRADGAQVGMSGRGRAMGGRKVIATRQAVAENGMGRA